METEPRSGAAAEAGDAGQAFVDDQAARTLRAIAQQQCLAGGEGLDGEPLKIEGERQGAAHGGVIVDDIDGG